MHLQIETFVWFYFTLSFRSDLCTIERWQESHCSGQSKPGWASLHVAHIFRFRSLASLASDTYSFSRDSTEDFGSIGWLGSSVRPLDRLQGYPQRWCVVKNGAASPKRGQWIQHWNDDVPVKRNGKRNEFVNPLRNMSPSHQRGIKNCLRV